MLCPFVLSLIAVRLFPEDGIPCARVSHLLRPLQPESCAYKTSSIPLSCRRCCWCGRGIVFDLCRTGGSGAGPGCTLHLPHCPAPLCRGQPPRVTADRPTSMPICSLSHTIDSDGGGQENWAPSPLSLCLIHRGCSCPDRSLPLGTLEGVAQILVFVFLFSFLVDVEEQKELESLPATALWDKETFPGNNGCTYQSLWN